MSLRIFFLFLIFICGVSIKAAQRAKVAEKDASIYQNPDTQSSVVDTLTPGTSITVSNIPTDGFYKVRTPDGKIGWISSLDLILRNSSANTAISSPAGVGVPTSLTQFEQPGKGKPFRILALGGMSLYSASALDTALKLTDGFYNGLHFGAELRFFVWKQLALSVRGELINQVISAVDQSQKAYDFSLSTVPLYAGIGYEVIAGKIGSLYLGSYFGVGANTGFSATITNSDPVQSVSSNDLPFSFLPKAELHVQVWDGGGFFVEAGYRVLASTNLTANDSTNTSAELTNFQKSITEIDLSGVLVGAGLQLKF